VYDNFFRCYSTDFSKDGIMWVRNSIHFGRCKQKQRGLRGLLCRCPSITEWEMHITAQGPRLRNDLCCVEWDVKLYYTIPYHFATASLITTQNVVAVCHYREGVCRRCKNWTLELDVHFTLRLGWKKPERCPYEMVETVYSGVGLS